MPSTYISDEGYREIRGRTEIERRGVYIELLESKLSNNHPALVELVKRCLHNDPQARPSTEELLTRLKEMRMEVQGRYGEYMIKVDIEKMRMARELQMMDRRVEELSQHQVSVAYCDIFVIII